MVMFLRFLSSTEQQQNNMMIAAVLAQVLASFLIMAETTASCRFIQREGMLAFCSSDKPDPQDRNSGSFLCALLLTVVTLRIVKIWDQIRLPMELAFLGDGGEGYFSETSPGGSEKDSGPIAKLPTPLSSPLMLYIILSFPGSEFKVCSGL